MASIESSLKPDAVLTRFDQGDQGTFGHFKAGDLALFTGELPPRDNRPDESCINPGVFQVQWMWSPHLKKFTYLLINVPGHGGIRLHSANYVGDVKKGFRAQVLGCIAPGEKLGVMDGQKAVLLSMPAVRRIETLFERKPFNLEIRNG